MAAADLSTAVARVETRVDEHDRRLDQVSGDIEKATEALWAAVDALRLRPSIHPAVATIIGTLTAAVGVLATFAVRGG